MSVNRIASSRLGSALTLLLALLGGLATPSLAQTDDERAREQVLSRDVGSVYYEGRMTALPFSRTFQGPIVALAPIVERLGGELQIGPLGQSHTLVLAGKEMVFGAESNVMTVGEEIHPMSRAPVAGEGGLQVPLDLLELTFGDLLGYEFLWYPNQTTLQVAHRPQRELAVEIDQVHSLGVTTLVLQFAETPRYSIQQNDDRIEVTLLGDRIGERYGSPVRNDPLIRRISVTAGRIVIQLEEGAVGAEPYVLRRDPWYQLVFDISRRRESGSEPVSRPGRGTSSDRNVLKIVVDPGHGGEETGAVGASGTAEKDLTLLLAQTLRARLERRLPVRVVLTRSEDVDLPLETRTALANQNQADLFISLHLNSELYGSGARGAETFFLSKQASDARAASSAERENRSATAVRSPSAGDTDGHDYGLQLILWDLAQSHHLAQSQRLANLIQGELNEALDLRDRGVKQAPFRVLMGATMPSVLVELGFLSNPEEEERLLTPAYRAQLIEALVQAIIRYRNQLRNLGAESAEGSP